MKTHRKLNERFVWFQRLQQTKRIDSSRRTAARSAYGCIRCQCVSVHGVWNENKSRCCSRVHAACVHVCVCVCVSVHMFHSILSVRWLFGCERNECRLYMFTSSVYSIRFLLLFGFHVFVNRVLFTADLHRSEVAAYYIVIVYLSLAMSWVSVCFCLNASCCCSRWILLLLLLFRWSIL